MSATFVRTVTHLRDSACLIEPGDSTTTHGPSVTCAGCRSQMPSAAHGCAHPRIFPTGRDVDWSGNVRESYRWNCVCGYRTTLRIADTPPAWLDIDDNRERIATIEQRMSQVSR